MIVPLAVLFSAALLGHLALRQELQGGSELPFAAHHRRDAPGDGLRASRRGVERGLSLIPVLNTSLVSKEIVSGIYHWNYIALIFGSSCLYAAAALWVAVRLCPA